MSTFADKLKVLIKPTVEALGFELWGIHYTTSGRQSVLRVFIDGPNGVSADDCARASRQISIVLDVEAPAISHYILEVSSPGLDRQLFELEHYRRSLHQQLAVKLVDMVNGRRNFTGELLNVTDDGLITLNVDGQSVVLPILKIHTAKIVF